MIARRGQRASAGAAKVALVWTLSFVALHVYWFAGGRFGFGDQTTDPIPGWPSSVVGWFFQIVTDGMWVAGVVVPGALGWSWGRRLPRRLLVGSMWAGATVLLARGGAGLIDDAVRFGGLYDGGLTGLSTKDLFGSADPSTYTKLSTAALDSIFFVGGLLFGRAARLGGSVRRRARASSTNGSMSSARSSLRRPIRS